MLLKGEVQTIDFDVDYLEKFNKIGIALSGGTDSALVLFLLAKFLPHKIIQPWCAHDVLRPSHIWYSDEIYLKISEIFPNVNIQPLYTFKYDISDPNEKEAAKKIPNPEKLGEKGWIKRIILRRWSRYMRDIGLWDITLSGLTSNPPLKVQREFLGGFDHICESRRNVHNPDKVNDPYDRKAYKPLINVDKKFVADMYHKFDLMDSIFPLTQSCIGYANSTDYWSKPCKKCYWCYERKWAFGYYDGEHPNS